VPARAAIGRSRSGNGTGLPRQACRFVARRGKRRALDGSHRRAA